MSIDYIFRGSPPSSAISSSPAIGLDITTGTLYTTAAGRWTPVGSTPSVVNFADAEVPTGSLNGINTSFTLAHTPSPASSLILVSNGLTLQSVTDYILSVNSLSLSVAPDTLISWYRY